MKRGVANQRLANEENLELFSSHLNFYTDCYERTGRILGAGAFSQVELCRCIRTGHEFAVKVRIFPNLLNTNFFSFYVVLRQYMFYLLATI